MKKLENKIAVITGGNSGIGYSSAKSFKENGAEVIITGRNGEKIKTAAQQLEVESMLADVTKTEHLDSLVQRIKEKYGKVDILFVNAGVAIPQPIGGVTEEHFEHQMQVNFKGAVFTIEKFLPILNDGASVICLSSIAAHAATPNMGIYAATKAAINAYVRTAAREMAGRKIRFNTINPGPIDTPIFSKMGVTEDQMMQFKDSIAGQIPLGRFGKPEEIASLVTYLASEDSSFISGSEFKIDGGMVVQS